MINKSVSLNLPVQFIETEKINPLISKAKVKILYTGPNRNKSFISKEIAEKMTASLPNIPIVAQWDEEEEDFAGHAEALEYNERGVPKIVKRTVPIGVVPSDTKIWWEKFLDNDKIERDYLCSEAYIWTSRYPKSVKIFDDSLTNQSMELDLDTLKGTWAQLENSGPEYFIIEEALFSALCVLGEEVEPCFEGASFYSLLENKSSDMEEDLNQLKKELAFALQEYADKVTNFPNRGDDKAITLRNSQWDLFDPAFAAMIKNDYPEIWRKGGNIRGNSQYAKLSEALGKKESDLSQSLKNAIKLREAWVARHFKDFRIAGVIAQIKWLAVGSKGEAYMKDLVREEIKKIKEKRKKDYEFEILLDEISEELEVRGHFDLQDKLNGAFEIFQEQEETKSMEELKEKELETEMEEKSPIVEIEDEEEVAEEMSLKDMITEVVKEVMASMKSEVVPGEGDKEDEEEKMEADMEKEVETDMAKADEKYAALEEEVNSLREKVRSYEQKEKQALIDKYSSNLDSAFVENILAALDSYGVDELEAKIAVELVRSGSIFKSNQEEVATYSVDFSQGSVPSWISAIEKKK